MAEHPTIQFTFTSEYPGRIPGELGIYSKTILEFVDRQGRILSLARKLKELQVIRHSSGSAFLEGGKFLRMRMFLENRRNRKEERLNTKIRQLLVRRLCNGCGDMELKVAPETVSSGFRPVQHQYQARDIADKLQKATSQWLWVVEPSYSS